jgi:hypothetical protein
LVDQVSNGLKILKNYLILKHNFFLNKYKYEVSFDNFNFGKAGNDLKKPDPKIWID